MHIKKMVFFLLAFMMIFGFATIASAYVYTDNDIALFEYYVEAGDVLGVELEHEGIEVLSAVGRWHQEGNNWYWYENNRRITGWRRILTGGRYFYYYLDRRVNNGRMATGWTDTGGNWYFLSPRSGNGHSSSYPEGAMRTGWVRYGANYFFLRTRDTGGTYGARLTGWLPYGANRYFLSRTGGATGGAMQTGWLRDGTNYFFLNPWSGQQGHRFSVPVGAMRTGRIATSGTFRDPAETLTSIPFPADLIVHNFRSDGVWTGQVNNTDRHMCLWWPRAASGNTVITYAASGLNATWDHAIRLGVDSWNSSPALVWFDLRTSTTNTILTRHTEGHYMGINRMHRSNTPITNETIMRRSEITLNTTEIQRTANRYRLTIVNVASSIMAHELGHTVGLVDYPRGVRAEDTIMSMTNTFINRNYAPGPRTFDIISFNLLPRP